MPEAELFQICVILPYTQKEGLSMGKSMSPSMAEIFMNHFEIEIIAAE